MIHCLPDDPSPWLGVLGRAHPVLLHLPLGLVPALAVLEFGAMLLRRPAPRGAVLALCWFTVLCAAATIVSGLVLAEEPGYGGDTVFLHKVAGIVLGSLCLVAALCALASNRLPLRVVLLLACVALLPAGHYGGHLTHGEAFLFAPLAKAPPADASEFVRTIRPIFQRCCTKCHNPHRFKGELDLSTIEGIQKGGESGEVIEAGKPDESYLVQVCELPEDDDSLMPPKGKQPRPSKHDLDTLRAWIAAGAKFE
jgi:hypothetical protein